MRSKTGLLALVVLILSVLALPGMAFAQSSVEFNRWDAQITARANSDQLQVAETQEIRVTGGTISRGSRVWTTPVQIQNIYVVAGSDSSPRQLQQSSSDQPSTYRVSQSGSQVTLNYTLPAAQSNGTTFTVQITYTATSPTTGMVDWKIVPAEHDFIVRSSTATIRFPDSQVADAGLIRASQSNATVQVNGNQVVIKSAGQIPARQAFSIQVPYGAGVGAAGGSSGNNPVPVNPGLDPANNPGLDPGLVPTGGNTFGIDLGSLVPILCIVGVVLLLGGGGLIRNLLGGGRTTTPSTGGGLFGSGSPSVGGSIGRSIIGSVIGSLLSGGIGRGGSSLRGQQPPPQNFTDDPPVERGFRSSANQDRGVGKVGDDKDSGGGASFS